MRDLGDVLVVEPVSSRTLSPMMWAYTCATQKTSTVTPRTAMRCQRPVSKAGAPAVMIESTMIVP